MGSEGRKYGILESSLFMLFQIFEIMLENIGNSFSLSPKNWCFLRELLLLDQICSASYHFQTS